MNSLETILFLAKAHLGLLPVRDCLGIITSPNGAKFFSNGRVYCTMPFGYSVFVEKLNWTTASVSLGSRYGSIALTAFTPLTALRSRIEARVACGATTDDLLLRAAIRRLDGDDDGADADLDEVFRREPTRPGLHALRGFLWTGASDDDRVIADVTIALQETPDDPFLYLVRGEALMKHGRFDDALADLHQALEIDPEYGDAYAVRGRIYERLGRDADALREFTTGVEIDPESRSSDFNLACLYFKQREYDNALSRLDPAVRKWPRYGDLHTARAQTLHALDRYPAALEAANQSVMLLPEFAGARRIRAEIWGALKDYGNAIAEIDAALTLDPHDVEAYWLRGVFRCASGDPNGGAADFRYVMSLGPRETPAERGWFCQAALSLAHCIAKADDYAGAIDALRTALPYCDPKDPVLHNDLAYALAAAPHDESRNGAEAVELAIEACRRSEFANASILDTLAAAYAEVGDFDSAIARQKEAIDKATPEVRERVAPTIELYRQGKPRRLTNGFA